MKREERSWVAILADIFEATKVRRKRGKGGRWLRRNTACLEGARHEESKADLRGVR